MLDKSNIALICILGMIGGFILSRAALSISVILFGANALRGINPKQWLRNKWWLLGVAWIAFYALTWFWSEDKGNWGTRLEVKLPILLLPLAFSLTPPFSPKQLRIFTLITGLLLTGSALYSLSFLLRDFNYYVSQYHIAHLMPTLPKNDYIRGSLTIALFVIWCIYIWPSLQGRGTKWAVAIIALFLTVFLHVLAAKSGIVSLYLFVVCWGIYLAIAKRKLAGILIICAIPAFLLVAVKTIPTFKERAKHLEYTYYMYTHGDRSGNYGDISRLTSYRVAMNVIKEHPLTGVGTGDMKHEMDKYYEQHYPGMPEYAKLLPHNQFLTVALGCGIPAAILFILWVFMPLSWLRRTRQSFFFFATWLIVLLQLMIEPSLEIQFGVFVCMFFLLLHKKQLDDVR